MHQSTSAGKQLVGGFFIALPHFFPRVQINNYNHNHKQPALKGASKRRRPANRSKSFSWSSSSQKTRSTSSQRSSHLSCRQSSGVINSAAWILAVSGMFSFFSCVHATLQVTMSVCRSVGLSVGLSVCLSHFAFLHFLGYSKVGKHIFEYLLNYKQHSRLHKSPCRSVGPSTCPTLLLLRLLGKCHRRQVSE